MNAKFTTKQLTLLGLFVGVMLIMACTPLGYLNVGPLAISFNMIPVALAAVTLGPVGGTVLGGVFGLTSFLQCMGIGGASPLGTILFGINPIFTMIVCFVPRMLDGLLLGYIFRAVRRCGKVQLACVTTGLFAAFLNTLFFMSALIFFFGNTEYMQGLIAGRNVLVFVCAFVGVNAVAELIASTIITGAVGFALYKAKLIPSESIEKK